MRLGDVCEVVMGQSPSSDSYNGDGEGFPFYQGNADFGLVHPNPSTWCTAPKKLADPGDLLLSVRAPIGAVNVANERCCIGRGVAALRHDRELVDSGFLRIQLEVRRSYLESLGTGSTFKAVGKKSLETFPLIVYPKGCQIAIVERFEVVSEYLNAARRQLALLDDLVKSRFVEMFGDGDYFISRLDEVACVQGGLTKNKRRECLPLQLPYLRVANVLDGAVDLSEMKSIGLTEAEAKKCLLELGDVLFVEGNGSADQIGRAAIWESQISPCVHQNHLIRARCSSEVLPIFVLHYFMSAEGRRQIISKAVSTSGLHTLSTGKIKALELPLPPLALQREFADFAAEVAKSQVVAQRFLWAPLKLRKPLS